MRSGGRLALVVVATLLGASSASAMPAFARKYQVSCQTCHAWAHPELNPYGWRFKENGYQLPKGAEEAYRARTSDITRGMLPLELFREPPISVRGRAVALAQKDTSVPPREQVSLFVPQRLDLLAGGSLAEDVSFMSAVTLAPTPFLAHLTFGVHNLFGDGVLNVRAGKFALLDFQRPSHRNLTRLGNPAQQVQVGANPFLLDEHHHGIQVWGRPKQGRFFYEAAVIQGVDAATTYLDVDLWKDGWARGTVDLGPGRLGAFGFLGDEKLTATDAGIRRSFQDPHSLLGVEGALLLPHVDVYAHALRGHHANPFALGLAGVTYWGGRFEGDVPITERLVAVVRYDFVRAPDLPTLDRHLVTAHLTLLVLANFRVSAEYTYSLRGLLTDTGSLALDAAF